MMWRETPYVVIGAHEPGKENKELVCGPCSIKALRHDWEAAILERDPETEKLTGIHMRIVFCNPDVMRKFGEIIIKGAELWETENKRDELKELFRKGQTL